MKDIYPPKSQHLVLFFMTKLEEEKKNLKLKLERDEVDKSMWISLD